MLFHPGFDPLPERANEHPAWRWLLLATASLGVLCSVSPWIRVRFSRLWGDHDGPPGWESSAGFTCLCSCALLVMLVFVETDTNSSRLAARPASLLLAALATLAIAFEWYAGPGTLRGVSASWTAWFYLLLAGIPLLCLSSARRWLSIAGQRG